MGSCKDMESLFGRTKNDMKGIGIRVKSMDMGMRLHRITKLKKDIEIKGKL